MIFKNIDLDDIDFNDRYFQLQNHRDKLSAFTTDMVPYFPIYLQPNGKGQFRVIDGFLVSAQVVNENLSNSIPAFIAPDSSDLLQLWKFRLQKRYLENNLSPFCFLEVLSQLKKHHSNDTILANLESAIRVSGYAKLVNLSEKLDGDSETMKSIKSFTDSYSLGMKEIDHLANITPPDLPFISTLFKDLNLKGNKLITILNLIFELKKGYGLEVKKLLDDSSIQEILTDLPPHQRYIRLKERLTELRYPKLHELEQSWKETKSVIGLPTRIAVNHDPEFESDDIRLTLTASSIQELQTQLETIQRKIETTDLQELFNFV
jgi:hypothetical protein